MHIAIPKVLRRKTNMELNGKKIDDVEVDGVDDTDYPDFCDAYFSYGTYVDGTELTEEELIALAEKYPETLNQLASRRNIQRHSINGLTKSLPTFNTMPFLYFFGLIILSIAYGSHTNNGTYGFFVLGGGIMFYVIFVSLGRFIRDRQ